MNVFRTLLIVSVPITITVICYVSEWVLYPLGGHMIKTNTTKRWNIEVVQKIRLKQFKDFCLLKNTSTTTLSTKHYLYVRPENKLLYCQIPKVASTNWKKIFLYLEGSIKNFEGHRDSIHELPLLKLSKMDKKNASLALENYFKFMIVRHPFERLVSAHRDKLNNSNSIYFKKEYGSKILRLYRKGLSKYEYETGEGVTFSEFVRWLIEKREFDEHWNSIFRLCFPCIVKFDFIGKMETLVEDSRAVLQRVGLDRSLFPSDRSDGYAVSSYQLMLKYFSELPVETIKALYNIYREDFLAFGYTIPKVLVKEE